MIKLPDNLTTDKKNPNLTDEQFYNIYCIGHLLTVMIKKTSGYMSYDPPPNGGWEKEEYWGPIISAPITEYDNRDKVHSVIRFKSGHFLTDNTTKLVMQAMPSSPFKVLARLLYKGNETHTAQWVRYHLRGFDSLPYVRVGVDYFKRIEKKDRYGNKMDFLVPWNRATLKEDLPPGLIKNVKKYDTFINEPNNVNYRQVIEKKYNKYHKLRHKVPANRPDPKKWKRSRQLMEHVFGDQFDLGMRYMQALYLAPKQMLPILVLTSRERQTGKTTFLNWVSMIFGENMQFVTPQDLEGSFNSIYAEANIIGIEETVIQGKKSLTEKLKALSTAKFLTVNMKHVTQYKLDFFGKFIITTNDSDHFATIASEEIRFWIRPIPSLKSEINTAIEQQLFREIPYFLAELRSMPEIDFSKSRMVFTKEEIATDQLTVVKKESKSWLYEELQWRISDWFAANETVDNLVVSPLDLKQGLFEQEKRVDIRFIRRVLKDEFQKKPDRKRYRPQMGARFFATPAAPTIVGRVYEFSREEVESWEM